MTVKPKKLLWPTDYSSLANKAAAYARELCELFGAELHVVHVVPSSSVSPILDCPPGAQLQTSIPAAEIHGARKAELARRVRELFQDPTKITCEVLVGTAWHETCNYARRNDIDLIVVATHGRTGLRHALIGSVAERIVQHAHCAVLVVKCDKDDANGGRIGVQIGVEREYANFRRAPEQLQGTAHGARSVPVARPSRTRPA